MRARTSSSRIAPRSSEPISTSTSSATSRPARSLSVAEAVDVDEGDGQRAVVALGARDLLGQALAEGAVVGQAGERVGRRLGVEPGAVLGVGHGGGDEVGVVLQALLGARRRTRADRWPRRSARPTARRRCAPARPGACSGARRRAGRARWPRRSAGGRAGCPGARRRWRRDPRAPCSSWVQRPRTVTRSASWKRTMAAQSAPSRRPASERDEREDARGRRAGGDRGRHAPQRGLLLGHPPLARPRARAALRVAPASSSRPATTTPPTRQ